MGKSHERAHDAAAALTPNLLYANHLGINFVLSEIELCFGQRFGAGDMVSPQAWLVTSPVHLVSFGALIQSAIARYEKRFGHIPDAGLGIARQSEA